MNYGELADAQRSHWQAFTEASHALALRVHAKKSCSELEAAYVKAQGELANMATADVDKMLKAVLRIEGLKRVIDERRCGGGS